MHEGHPTDLGVKIGGLELLRKDFTNIDNAGRIPLSYLYMCY